DVDPSCVQVLNDIVAQADAEVVVSSTWRHGKTVAELQAILEASGFAGRVLDKTPTGSPGMQRGGRIPAWAPPTATDRHVRTDDHGNMGALRHRLVQTHPSQGLRPGDVPRAVAVLARPISGRSLG